MSIDIRLEPRGKKINIIGDTQIVAMKERLAAAIEDIATTISDVAREYAPISKPDDKLGSSTRGMPPSGTLKAHPVDISRGVSGFTTVADIRGEAEGYRSIRGTGGRFVPGKGTSAGIGHVFYSVSISYPEYPFYAKYVAFGVPGHGPRGEENMKFRYKNRGYNTPWVSGQEAQPYLGEAISDVNIMYVPIRISELRREADAIL
jgi:hypothetical protein